MLRVMALVAAAPLIAIAGCAGSFSSGIARYDRAEYPQALESLAAIERDAAGWSPDERARYALYRGLTHLALGDRVATERWLGVAKRAYDADPEVFSDADAGRLASAWAHLPEAR